MTAEHNDFLKLENQLCFRFYTVSRLITRAYQPYLDKIGLTYIQYIVMLVLWEEDQLPVGEFVKRLGLNTNTLTPLLKRMEQAGFISRSKSERDERSIIVSLTDKGKALYNEAQNIPTEIQDKLSEDKLSESEYLDLRARLDRLIELLGKEQ